MPDLNFELVPSDGDASDEHWQQECQDLALRLRQELKSLDATVSAKTIQPEYVEGVRHRAIDMQLFSSLTVGLVQAAEGITAISMIVEIIAPWLKRREGKMVIKGSDGSTFEMDGLSKEELFEMLERYGPVKNDNN